MAKTSRDAYRHMRALSALFTEMFSVNRTVIEELAEHGTRRKYLQQTLARLIAKGYLEDEGARVKVTKRGLAFFRRRHPVSFPSDQPLRDGKWYLLSFDIPVRFNSKRIALGRILKKYNFVALQKSVWVGPHGLSKDVWEFIVDQKIERFCTPMIVDILEGDEPLRKHFKLR
ncbi:MAG: hypothetical protein Q8P88_03225 [Candidatus Jorgensenbacteria bacterium]|nr:hypothetical protein [Candidatus Jorgensenbacteria bacterium]